MKRVLALVLASPFLMGLTINGTGPGQVPDCAPGGTVSSIVGTSQNFKKQDVSITVTDPGVTPGNLVICAIDYSLFIHGVQAPDTSWTNIISFPLLDVDGEGVSIFTQNFPGSYTSAVFQNDSGLSPEDWASACIAVSGANGLDGAGTMLVNTSRATSMTAPPATPLLSQSGQFNIFAMTGIVSLLNPIYGTIAVQQNTSGPSVGIVTYNPTEFGPPTQSYPNPITLSNPQFAGAYTGFVKCGQAPTPSATVTPSATATATATATNSPSPTATPTPGTFISTIVVIIPENHSYDNLFGLFPCTGGNCGASTATLSTGATYSLTHTLNQYGTDMCHTYQCALTAENGTSMNGFDLNSQCRVGDTPSLQCLSQYQSTDEPNLWYLAQTFSMSDSAFPDLGPSYGNHIASAAATEFSVISNPSGTGASQSWGHDAPIKAADCVGANNPSSWCTGAGACSGTYCGSTSASASLLGGGTIYPSFDSTHKTIMDSMITASKTVGAYEINQLGSSGYFWNAFDYFVTWANGTTNWTNFVLNDTAFDAAAKAGTLPQLSFVTTSSGYSDHPNAPHCTAENYIVGKLNAISQGSQWPHILVVIAWDDFGGTYDHVSPPANFGIRTPFMVISPYSKGSSYISHVELHTWGSITREIEEVFGLPSLGKEDASANDLNDMLDFTRTPIAASAIGSTLLPQRATSIGPASCTGVGTPAACCTGFQTGTCQSCAQESTAP